MTAKVFFENAKKLLGLENSTTTYNMLCGNAGYVCDISITTDKISVIVKDDKTKVQRELDFDPAYDIVSKENEEEQCVVAWCINNNVYTFVMLEITTKYLNPEDTIEAIQKNML